MLRLLGNNLMILALWVAATLSALLVVWSAHETRSLLGQLLSMHSGANVLMVEHGQLQLQERSLTNSAEIEVMAVQKLGLRFPRDEDIQVLMP